LTGGSGEVSNIIKTLSDDKNIISITDIIEQKVRKEAELRNFEAQLKELLNKKFFLEKDIQIHEFIIQAVRDEITPQAFIQGLIKAELKSDPKG
jgi:hypothetical protein